MKLFKIVSLVLAFCLLFTACATAQTGMNRKPVASRQQLNDTEATSVLSQQNSIHSATSDNLTINTSQTSSFSTISSNTISVNSHVSGALSGISSYDNISSVVSRDLTDISTENSNSNDNSANTINSNINSNIIQTSSVNSTVDINSVPDYLKNHPVMEGTRDKYYWPFSKDSIWNMPIGSNAQLEPAGFKKENAVGIDPEYFVKVSENDPIVKVYYISSWKDRMPGSNIIGELKVPNDFMLADGTGENNCSAFVMPNGYSFYQLCGVCRTAEYPDRIIGGIYNEKPMSLYEQGIGGSHFGSGLSAIGGSIRRGELTSDGNINHAIKLCVWANKYLYYSNDIKGYTWPADRCDSYANRQGDVNEYNGKNPLIVQGSLLALPRNETIESLGLTTEVGKKLFYAFQNYGAYIVDDTTRSAYVLAVENGVNEEVEAKYGYSLKEQRGGVFYSDLMKIIQKLCVVTNNSPDSIGGGGTPCQPLAPDFAE